MRRMGFLLALLALLAAVPLAQAQETTETTTIQPNEIGVLIDLTSGTLETPLRAGIHTINPAAQAVFIYSLAQQNYTMEADEAVEARTTDGQAVYIDAALFYSIDPETINELHLRWGDRFASEFVRPVVRTALRDTAALYTAEDLIGGARTAFAGQVRDALATRLEAEGFTLSDFLLLDLRFSDAFTEALEQRAMAEQQVQAAQLEAERARIQAQAARDAAILQAEGEAQTALLRAQAEAEVLRLYGEQIAAFPSLIPFEFVRRLADNVRVIVVAGDNPFSLDLQGEGE